jgi:DNA (cytosine-5)-methyltransferase 1
MLNPIKLANKTINEECGEMEFGVVDLFAGPGGLAEGFSSVRDPDTKLHPFRVVLSVEKEKWAYETLRLRTFLRQFTGQLPKEYYQFLNGRISEPNWKTLYPAEWEQACSEALHLELGTAKAAKVLNARLDSIRKRFKGQTILIGGPPCQAYSLVGRARNKGVAGYSAKDDRRHFLYQEYIQILARLKPAAFVMENVKGLLSSSVDGQQIFEKVLRDLSKPPHSEIEYKLIPLAPRPQSVNTLRSFQYSAYDFVVRAEDHGIPQARHRVIIVGIREDIAKNIEEIDSLRIPLSRRKSCLRHVIGGMPKLRSGVSKKEQDEAAWRTEVAKAASRIARLKVPLNSKDLIDFRKKARNVAKALKRKNFKLSRTGEGSSALGRGCPAELQEWLIDRNVKVLRDTETRSHMAADLARYLYASLFAEVTGKSPKADQFPPELAPRHKNWKSGKFADRFRVQVWDAPSTTVTSHISKDGHYFIHPDPRQCRSLTVREVARLQTFPDNYYFKGGRTQQYTQIGNAVPPLLANKIAAAIYRVLKISASAKSYPYIGPSRTLP